MTVRPRDPGPHRGLSRLEYPILSELISLGVYCLDGSKFPPHLNGHSAQTTWDGQIAVPVSFLRLPGHEIGIGK